MSFVQEARGKDWEYRRRIARRMRDQVFGSRDFQEGLRAFREKRGPRGGPRCKILGTSSPTSMLWRFLFGYQILGWGCFTFPRARLV